MKLAGISSAEEFESQHLQNPKYVVLTKGLWGRYLRGEVIPQGAKTSAEGTLVKHMEERFPGTALTFKRQVWRLLDFDTLLGPEELREICKKLGAENWQPFFYASEECHSNRPPEDFEFWHRPLKLGDLWTLMFRDVHPLDGVALCLIEARLGYLAQDVDRFLMGLATVQSYLNAMSASASDFHWERTRSAILTMEGICLLHALKLLRTAPKSFDGPTAPRRQVHCWFEQWSDRSFNHRLSLPRIASNAFEGWNDELIKFQGLFGQKSLFEHK